MEKDSRYKIETDIDTYEITERDNQDGTINMIYKGRSPGEVNFLTEKGKIIKAKEKKTVSRSILGAMWHYHNINGLTELFDDYYQRIGKKISAYLPEIIEYLDTKKYTYESSKIMG